MDAVKSPLKWHGGKTYLAKWIISHFPPHTRYVEPFFGGGSVLLAKDPEGVAEFANDIYGELAGFWKVLQNPKLFQKLQQELSCVPLSKREFEYAKHWQESGMPRIISSDEQIGRAINFLIVNRQSRQGLGKDYCTPTSRLRRGMNENVSAWLSAVDGLTEVHERLRRVEIWNRDVRFVLTKLDSHDTLFYLDPPYLHETRQAKNAYVHEMTYEEHDALLMELSYLKGKFVLSGYPNELYDRYAKSLNWHVSDQQAPLHSSSKATKEKRTERLWMNFDPHKKELETQ